jgi:AAA+ ATPase superfamily predicted ATPase
MKKLYLIEGSRNVGKTFLMNQLQNIDKYKYPFSGYFNESFVGDFKELSVSDINLKSEIHYYSLAADTALLDLFQYDYFKNDLVADRGFISSLVHGVHSKRITYKQALNEGKYIVNKYKEFYKIILITANINEDNRDKDMWTIYNQKETNELYKKLLNDLNIGYIEFENTFDIESVQMFNHLFM